MRLLSVAMLSCVLAGAIDGTSNPTDGRFAFVRSNRENTARFLGYVRDCVATTEPFARLLSRIPDSLPLVTEVVNASNRVLFASAFRNDNSLPLLSVDVLDISRLPTAEDVRTWSPDSSWAWTRCEVLAHEVAEAIEYRRRWQYRPTGADSVVWDGQVAGHIGAAHALGLRTEAQVAHAQRTRADRNGDAYIRTRGCFQFGSVHIVFENNTETLGFSAGALTSIAYNRGIDLCGFP